MWDVYVILQILHLKLISLWIFYSYSFAHSQFEFFHRVQSHDRTCTDDPHTLLINSITRMLCIDGFLIFYSFKNLFAYVSIVL